MRTAGSRPIPPRPASTLAERRIAELGVLAVTVVWAANFIVVKAALAVLPPVGFAWVRFSLAAIVLLGLLRWREGSIRIAPRELAPIALLGVLGFGIYQILWTTALQSISAGDSALLIAATPVMTAMLAVVAGSDVLTPAKLAGALVSFAGVGIVVAGEQGLDLGGSLVGDLLTLTAALLWAVYTAFGAPILRRHSPLRTTTWAIVAGALVLAPPGLAELRATDLAQVGPDAWAGVLFSAVLPAALANVVVFHAVRLLGPTRITAFQFLVPAFAVVLAFVFLDEPIRLAQIAGGAVIVLGVALTRRGSLAGLFPPRWVSST